MIPQIARFIFAGNARPRIEEALAIGETARYALMSERFGSPIPPMEFSGRNAGGPLRDDSAHTHAFFLPEDADGDGLIDHLIVYCRIGFSHEARRRLNRLTRLWLSHGDPGEHEEWTLALEGLAGPEAAPSSLLLGKAHVWASASPYLKNRFDKRRPIDFNMKIESYRKQIAFEWKQRFPNTPPPTVEPLTDYSENVTRFAAPLGPAGALRSPLAFKRTRAGRHGGRQPDTSGGFFRLIFNEDVEGPISLGWGAHFGLGLFCRNNSQKQ